MINNNYNYNFAKVFHYYQRYERTRYKRTKGMPGWVGWHPRVADIAISTIRKRRRRRTKKQLLQFHKINNTLITGFAYEIKLQVQNEIRILMNPKINKTTPKYYLLCILCIFRKELGWEQKLFWFYQLFHTFLFRYLLNAVQSQLKVIIRYYDWINISITSDDT